MGDESRAVRNRNWFKSGEGAGYTSVSNSVKVCTRLSLPVANWLSKEQFHNDREMSKCCKMRDIYACIADIRCVKNLNECKNCVATFGTAKRKITIVRTNIKSTFFRI